MAIPIKQFNAKLSYLLSSNIAQINSRQQLADELTAFYQRERSCSLEEFCTWLELHAKDAPLACQALHTLCTELHIDGPLLQNAPQDVLISYLRFRYSPKVIAQHLRSSCRIKTSALLDVIQDAFGPTASTQACQRIALVLKELDIDPDVLSQTPESVQEAYRSAYQSCRYKSSKNGVDKDTWTVSPAAISAWLNPKVSRLSRHDIKKWLRLDQLSVQPSNEKFWLEVFAGIFDHFGIDADRLLYTSREELRDHITKICPKKPLVRRITADQIRQWLGYPSDTFSSRAQDIAYLFNEALTMNVEELLLQLNGSESRAQKTLSQWLSKHHPCTFANRTAREGEGLPENQLAPLCALFDIDRYVFIEANSLEFQAHLQHCSARQVLTLSQNSNVIRIERVTGNSTALQLGDKIKIQIDAGSRCSGWQLLLFQYDASGWHCWTLGKPLRLDDNGTIELPYPNPSDVSNEEEAYDLLSPHGKHILLAALHRDTWPTRLLDCLHSAPVFHAQSTWIWNTLHYQAGLSAGPACVQVHKHEFFVNP